MARIGFTYRFTSQTPNKQYFCRCMELQARYIKTKFFEKISKIVWSFQKKALI